MKEKRKLSKWEKMDLAQRPRLNDLLKTGKVVTTTRITEEGGWPSETINVVRIPLYNVVPTCGVGQIQQQAKDCRRRVRVTIELI